MRIIRTLLRGLPAGILALLLLLGVFTPAAADTGTYRISDYTVTLEPQNDGQVKMTFEQTWEVTGGNIPWITVGLPNSHFQVLDYGGAADAVKAANSSDFSGVRVDLDERYLAGDSFSLNFSVLQNNLLERLTAEKSWRIVYTPGWYDRAEIDRLRIRLISPVETATYSTLSPAPDSTENNILVWQSLALAPGEKLKIKAQSTDGSFLTVETPAEESRNWFLSPAFWIVLLAIILIGVLISLSLRRFKKNQEAALQRRIAAYEKSMAEDKEKKAEIEGRFEKYLEEQNIQPDAEGRYYDRAYGNYITPAIWMAAIYYQQQQQIAHAAAGGTDSGPHTPSCACVSCACACACACAGGGAAGCSRKTLHECPICHPPAADAGTPAEPLKSNPD